MISYTRVDRFKDHIITQMPEVLTQAVFTKKLQATPAMSTSRISILSLMSK